VTLTLYRYYTCVEDKENLNLNIDQQEKPERRLLDGDA